MHEGQEGAPPFGTPSPRAVRSAASRPPAADHRRLRAAVCAPGRDREHPRAGYPPVWPPASALSRARQNPSTTSSDGCSPERRAAGGVVRRDAAGEDMLLPLCCPEGSVGIRHQCHCWYRANLSRGATECRMTEQPPAEAGGLVLWTESPDTGQRPVVRTPCESCPPDPARSDVPDTLGSSLPSSVRPWHKNTRVPRSAVPR